MKGMELALVRTIHETVQPCDALKEFIDNSIDAGAKNILVSFNNGTLTIADDGKGMVDKMKGFAEKFKMDITSKANSNLIGLKHEGAKKACIRFSNPSIGSVVRYDTWANGKHEYLIWRIDEHEQENISRIDFYEEEYDGDKVGTTVSISNSSVTSNIIGGTKKQIAYSHSFFTKYLGVKIMFNVDGHEEEIRPRDYFYLNGLIGENGNDSHRLTTEGEYESPDKQFYYIVRTPTFNNEHGKKVTIPMIAIYIKGKSFKHDYDKDDDAYKAQKFGVLWHNRYITTEPECLSKHLIKATNRGGSHLYRLLIIADSQEVYDILTGSASNKSNGVKPIKDNVELNAYTTKVKRKKFFTRITPKNKSKNENEIVLTVSEYFESVYDWLNKINLFRQDTTEERDMVDGTWNLPLGRVTDITINGYKRTNENSCESYEDLNIMVPFMFQLSDDSQRTIKAIYDAMLTQKIPNCKMKKILEYGAEQSALCVA